MPQTITKGIKALLDEANATVITLGLKQAMAPVAHIEGGFSALAKAGGPVQEVA